jgi:outer membrane protein OmpA-like peptidoglycan-associated protein
MTRNDFLQGLRPLRAIAVAMSMTLAACAQPQPVTQANGVAPTASAAPSSAPKDVQLFFGDGSTALTEEADQKLDFAARLYREGNPVVMFVSGHADKSGAEYRNLVLSGERARTVKQALVARGIPADRLQLRAMGTSLPEDPNTPMPEDNRRVVITWR